MRWQILDLPIAEITTEEGLIEAVVEAVDGARSDAGRSIVARVRLTGRGPMHASLRRSGIAEDVLATARESLGTVEPFAWIESLRDRTRPDIDLEERRKADDFVGDLLTHLDETRSRLAQDAAEAPAAEELDGALDDLFGHSRARRYLRSSRPSAAEVARLLDEAEALLLDRLGDED